MKQWHCCKCGRFAKFIREETGAITWENLVLSGYSTIYGTTVWLLCKKCGEVDP